MSSVNLFSILFDRSLAFGRQKKDQAATEKSSSCNHHAIQFFRFWHGADIKLRPLFGRYWVESGLHWLVMSISAYDP